MKSSPLIQDDLQLCSYVYIPWLNEWQHKWLLASYSFWFYTLQWPILIVARTIPLLSTTQTRQHSTGWELRGSVNSQKLADLLYTHTDCNRQIQVRRFTFSHHSNLFVPTCACVSTLIRVIWAVSVHYDLKRVNPTAWHWMASHNHSPRVKKLSSL